MTSKTTVTGAALALAAASLFASLSTQVVAEEASMVHCYGVNACKGHNDCKTAKNACKGLGFSATSETAGAAMGAKYVKG